MVYKSEYSLYSSPTKAILSNDISHQQTVSHNLFTNNLVDNNNNNNNTKNKQKIILLWTTFFGQTNYVQSLYESSNCLTKKNCLFTSNRSYLVDSDAVIFHLRDLDLKDWPPIRTPNQRYILLNQESPANTPKILHKIEGLINWTATYRYGSDIFLNPIFRHRSEPNPSYRGDANYAQNKSRMIVWMASNCRTDSNREMYVEELKKTVPVDVYGKCGDKVCLPKMSPKCLDQISRKYRFILAFENSICRDYITEKYFDTLHYDIIPIVFGGSDYRSIAPQKTSIDALSYSSPRHLARYLLYLSKNPKQYNEYFKWKRDYELTGQHYSCQICQKLNDPTEPVKVWDNLEHWWFTEAECRKWSPTKNFR
ncbi:alpha-(1,3)-fucosyltransferase C-like [Oppia nitens]|uniref:alpha-(1,3)-fucosyltransferase C-like n=1 Tax=Oppia nitens TaxID=1686743 RepID=UPI0023DC49E8|nr:alpha-(1,3)-fucosyltransferase C-like [Oppia nitens]